MEDTPLETVQLAQKGGSVQCNKKGIVDIKIRSSEGSSTWVRLTNVLYIPDLDTNLLSVSAFAKNGIKSYFDASSCILSDEDGTFGYGEQWEGACKINTSPMNGDCSIFTFGARVQSALDLWHRRLGHLNKQMLQKNDLQEISRRYV